MLFGPLDDKRYIDWKLFSQGETMAGNMTNIEQATLDNVKVRRVMFTGPHTQLVVMSLKPGEESGLETHDDVDPLIRVEARHGTALLDGKEHALEDGSAVVIPAGTKHGVINNSRTDPLKLYTIYSPPEDPDGTTHETRADAER